MSDEMTLFRYETRVEPNRRPVVEWRMAAPRPPWQGTLTEGRWLTKDTFAALTADRDALRAERDAALKVADVATDAAAKAVLDAKEVYEVRHLATIRDLRALLREARLRTSLGPPTMDGSSWGQRVDAALREGG